MDALKLTPPATEYIDISSFEIYDSSGAKDDTLVWLLEVEELPELGEPAESCESGDLEAVCGPETTALACAIGEQPDFPEFPVQQFESADEQLLPPDAPEGGDSSGISLTSSPLTYRASTPVVQTRWMFRVMALVGILLIGSTLPLILEHVQSTQKSSATFASSARNQSAKGTMNDTVRVLTVMAGREETIKSISLRYVGHFDQDLFEEIHSLNPDLKDPDHLQDGQLIKLPLRRRIQ